MSFFKVDKVIPPITPDNKQLTYLLGSDTNGYLTHCFAEGVYCVIPTYKNLIIVKID